MNIMEFMTSLRVMEFWRSFLIFTVVATPGYYALASANKAHSIFEEFYRENRRCFSAVLTDVGLGIGIDAGRTHLVRLGGGLTVVGTPVGVRLSNERSPSWHDFYLNQTAFEEIDSEI